MPERLLQLDDVRNLASPEKIAALFARLGYPVVVTAQPLPVEALELPARSAEAIDTAYLIADYTQGADTLQVLLFQLRPDEWESPSVASNRMKAIATALVKRPANYLLLATNPAYDRLMLVNPRKSFDAKMNLKVSIRKLLIDRTNPTAYDRDRLEAIAARDLSPAALYKAQSEAFDVDRLTKDFYRGYEKLFDRVQAAVKQWNPEPYFEDADRLHQFSQRLLGRIMFLYFLQKKEFLAGDRRFLTNQYRQLRPDPNDTDYYATVLEPLFFETLNQDRPNLESQWGKIPYLNGGLFDRDYGPGVRDLVGRETPDQIRLPNALFDPGSQDSILAFFNSYNFTISENVQGDEDVAVDPEMLGKVFENLLAKEERGQSGTFYTPRGIVNFMCTEVLCRYLANQSGIALETIRELMELEPDAPDAEISKTLSREQAKTLKKAIETVKVLDPAVGSGAFPLGMLQAILAVRQVIARREGITVQRGSLAISQWKREIIANNLYGVDIKPEAIEIAKLRMWLSLVVDIPHIEDVEPLPNLDYKLMCGDSLISTINGEHIIPDPRKDTQLALPTISPLSAEIQALINLEQQFYSADAATRQQLRAQILEAERSVFVRAIADRREYLTEQQQETTRKLSLLKRPSKDLKDKQAHIAQTLIALNQFEQQVLSGERSLTFFQYHLHFRDVFENGGFDIVIGNPPYVRQEQFKELKPALQQDYQCYTGTADLFVYFYEQGFNLLKPGGYLTYISSNKYMRSGYGEKLRKFLAEQSTIHYLIDFGDANVFEAIAYPSILLIRKTKPQNHSTQALTWQPNHNLETFASVFQTKSFLILQKELTPDGWRLESPSTLRLLEKLREAGTPLGEYVNKVNKRSYRGILTGLNEAFVVDRATRDALIAAHPSSAEVLKPFVRGR
ncbi:MAG: Eco57I restriction-modification methylase domain-containing protein, partial [Cyanobacteriota bacterium]